MAILRFTVQKLTIYFLQRKTVGAIHAQSYHNRCRLMIDPLTAAVCSLEEIRQLFDEMISVQKPFLPEFLYSLPNQILTHDKMNTGLVMM